MYMSCTYIIVQNIVYILYHDFVRRAGALPLLQKLHIRHARLLLALICLKPKGKGQWFHSAEVSVQWVETIDQQQADCILIPLPCLSFRAEFCYANKEVQNYINENPLTT